MTNFGRQTQQYSRNFTKAVLYILAVTTGQIAAARSGSMGQNVANDYIYVQAPAFNSNQAFTYQPVITPGQIPDNQLNQVGHVWPRSISYSMETKSVEAYVQSDLQMGMQYNYSFNFDLGARSGEGRGMAVPEGWYQLQVAVIKKVEEGSRTIKRNTNPLERYVTSTSMFLKVSNSSFGRRISLRFPDIRATSLKHHLFIELIPLQEECEDKGVKIKCINVNARGEADANNSILEPRSGYKTYLVEMPFIPFQPAGGKVRDADDLSEQEQAFLGGSLAKYIARAQLFKNRQALKAREAATPSTHASKNNLALMAMDDARLGPSASVLRKLIDDKSLGTIEFEDNQKAALANLCTLLVTQQDKAQPEASRLPKQLGREVGRATVIRTNIRWCTQKPEEYMRLVRVVHVGLPIPGKIERLAQKPLTYTLMANFMSNRSVSRDAYSSVVIKPPDFVNKLLDFVGLSFSHSVTVGNSRSRSETGVASMADSLDFNYVIFNVPTTGSQQCMEVRPQVGSGSFFSSDNTDNDTGLYICDRKDDAIIETPEIYAHVFERCKDTTMMECDQLSQSLNRVLRGENEVSAFFYAIRFGIKPDHNNRVAPFGDVKGAEKYFLTIPHADNMEIITPVEFPHEVVPSFFELATGRNRQVIN